MKFTLRQLEIFLATARYENISRAADDLSLSQSAASSALKDLESRYDTQLFDRVGKRLKLNSQGIALRPIAEGMLHQAGELEAMLQSDGPIGSLSIGATMTIGNYLAIPMIAEYRRQHPDIAVTLHVANTEHIVNEVLNYEMDVGLIEGEYRHDDLVINSWCDDELVVFCSPSHELADAATISDEDLLRAKWILREQGSGTRQTFDRAMQGLLNDIDVYMELEHTEGIKRAVEAGMGVSCLSRIALLDAFSRGSLVELPVGHRNFQRQLYVLTRKGRYMSAGILAWFTACGVSVAKP